MSKYKNISVFEGLNSLRFFAAFMVLMHHAETIRNKNGLYNLDWLGLFKNGVNAVTFFFVLSGFLITYLLLKENNQKGTISIKNFYIKRTLRIWPLYFLLFALGTLLLPFAFKLLNINYEMPYTIENTWYYFVFFLPGLVTFYFGHHFLEPLWSIGVEEVFYLIWAPLFKLCKKYILPILISIILLKAALLVVGIYFVENKLFNYIIGIFSFEAMAIGGLGAYFIFHRQKSLSNMFIYKMPIQIFIYSLLALYLIFNINITNAAWDYLFNTPVISKLIIEFLFLYLIIGVSLIDNNIIKLRNKFLSYLGEISYGIYMYQMLVIFAIIQVFKKYLLLLNPALSMVAFYLLATVLIIIVSAISKTTFENYFLNLKKRLHRGN
jgi:peptidoglycan/LPS O-acetylase OafA/YrhL